MPTKYFLKDTNVDTNCDSGAVDADISITQGTPTTLASANTQSATYELIQQLDRDVSGDSGFPVTGDVDVSVDVATASPAAEFEYLLSVARIDSGCVTGTGGGFLIDLTGTGIHTFSGAFPSWTGSIRLALQVQGRRPSGHGNKFLTLNVNDPDSFINAPWPVSGPDEVPLLMAQYQPG